MNNEEMSDMIQKLGNMLNQSNHSDSSSSNDSDTSSSNEFDFQKLQDLLSNMTSRSEEEQDSSQENNNDLNFDFETILKIKTIMDKVNSTKNSPEANLLMALKPYLNPARRQKLDQYMQFLRIANIIKALLYNN